MLKKGKICEFIWTLLYPSQCSAPHKAAEASVTVFAQCSTGWVWQGKVIDGVSFSLMNSNRLSLEISKITSGSLIAPCACQSIRSM